MALVLHFEVEDGFGLDAGGVCAGIFSALLDDGFDMGADSVGNEDLCLTLSLDTDRFLPSMHSFPEFTSFAEIDGELYATGPFGIHRIGGDTDNGMPIHTGVIWGRTDFGISNRKRLRASILMGQVDNAVIAVEADDGAGMYPTKRNRVAMGRNVVGRNWSVRIADFERLEGIEFIPTILAR